MRLHNLSPLLILCLALSGCGGLMAAMNADTIEENPLRRTVGQQIEDENIETKAVVNIHAADPGFDNAHLTVVSFNGYLLIAGQVPTEELKQTANRVARKIRHVRRIYNELEIASPSSAMTRTSDTWISAKVKSILLGRSDVEGTRVKVVAENGVVFLMGLATQEEADRIAGIVSEIGGVQRVVRLFEIVDTAAPSAA